MLVSYMLFAMAVFTLWDNYGPYPKRFRFRDNFVPTQDRLTYVLCSKCDSHSGDITTPINMA